MPKEERKLILIIGIPGTGKTCYGKRFAEKFGFIHHDLEDADTFDRFRANPIEFIDTILKETSDLVVTWGFSPNEPEIAVINHFKEKGFTLVWFDGNRPRALKAFNKRGDVPEDLFHVQISRIENSKVILRIEPLVINTFDENENFKDPATVLGEILQADE